jgi:hypothetical protein
MKLFLIILTGCLTAIFLIFLYFTFAGTNSTYNISENEKMILSVEKLAGKQIATRNEMQYMGSGGGMKDGKIRMSSLSFSIPKPLRKKEARRLIVACIQEYLQIINQNEELRTALLHFPFTIEDVELTVYSKYPDGRKVYDPYIGVVFSGNNTIYYRSNDPANEYKYKLREEETFEEALKILAMEKISL